MMDLPYKMDLEDPTPNARSRQRRPRDGRPGLANVPKRLKQWIDAGSSSASAGECPRLSTNRGVEEPHTLISPPPRVSKGRRTLTILATSCQRNRFGGRLAQRVRHDAHMTWP